MEEKNTEESTDKTSSEDQNQPFPPSQQSANQQTNIKKSDSSLVKILIFTLSIFIAISFALGGYILGQRKSFNNQVKTPRPDPTITKVIPTTRNAQIQNATPTQKPLSFQGIPISENTVSFTKDSGKTYLRYRKKIYTQQKEGELEPNQESFPNSNDLDWYGLINSPSGLVDDDEFNRLFSFIEMVGKDDFVFVMRWGKPGGQDFEVYYFNGHSISMILSNTSPGVKENYSIPKIDKISPDNKYISFSMFSCWNCGGHMPETLILNLNSQDFKIIGQVMNFVWKSDGNYEYKDYITKPCAEPGPGECFEDPSGLPLKQGKF